MSRPQYQADAYSDYELAVVVLRKVPLVTPAATILPLQFALQPTNLDIAMVLCSPAALVHNVAASAGIAGVGAGPALRICQLTTGLPAPPLMMGLPSTLTMC